MNDAGSSHRLSFRVHSYELDVAGRACAARLLRVPAGGGGGRRGAARGLDGPPARGRARLGDAAALDRVREPPAGRRLARRDDVGAPLRACAGPSRLRGSRRIRRADRRGHEPLGGGGPRHAPADAAAGARARRGGAGSRGAHGRARAARAVERPELERRFEVRRGDLDALGHVNNTRYVEWALDAVPDEVLDGLHPAGVDVEFRREALPGDVVLSRTARAPGDGIAFAHELRSAVSRHGAGARQKPLDRPPRPLRPERERDSGPRQHHGGSRPKDENEVEFQFHYDTCRR